MTDLAAGPTSVSPEMSWRASEASATRWVWSNHTTVDVDSPSPSTTLEQTEAALDRVKEILDWGDDWDGEGSPGYTAATWLRVRDLLLGMARRYASAGLATGLAPRVLPGPDGAIDVLWQWRGRQILVSMPARADARATYYGETETGATTKGELDSRRPNDWSLHWLTQ